MKRENSISGEGIVSLAGVHKTYETDTGDVHALDPVSFKFDRGEILSVVGPSGCGKSTLLRILAGIEPASGGQIVIGGKQLTGPTPDMGIVFQRDLLLDWRNVLENVMLPAELAKRSTPEMRDRAIDLLSELGVADFANRYPYELSGGMRQRVAIARALLLRPSMLLLDEPFSALDAMTRDQMNVILQRLQQHEEVTTLLITHSIVEAVFLSDKVLVMSPRPGRVLDLVDIDLPKPRPLSVREEPAFTEITRRIRVQFERAGVLAA